MKTKASSTAAAAAVAEAEAEAARAEVAWREALAAHERAEREWFARPGRRASNVMMPIERPELPTAGAVTLARSIHEAALAKLTAARAALAAADGAAPAAPVCRFCTGTAGGGKMVPLLDGQVYACTNCLPTLKLPV